MSNKAAIQALDELIVRCEESIMSPFKKKKKGEEEVLAQPIEENVAEDQSDDDSTLEAFYESLEGGGG